MRVLVLGGSGFVTGAIVRAALSAGHETWSVTRGTRPVPAGVHHLEVDRNDHRALTSLLGGIDGGWDLVVDGIAFGPEDTRQDLELFASRATHLVLLSTDAVLDLSVPVFPKSDACGYSSVAYGAGKRACELVLIESAASAMRWTILRPSHVYGPGAPLGCQPWHLRDPDLLARLRAGESLRLIGAGCILQQPVYVGDVAGAVLSCAGAVDANGRAFFLAGPETVEARRYYEYVAASVGARLRIVETPIREFVNARPDLAFVGEHRAYGDVGKTLTAAGLAPPQTHLRAGIGVTVKWLDRRAT